MPADYINKLARMFQDIKVSNDLNQGFKKEYQDKGDIAGKLLFVIKCFLPLSQAYKLWAHHVVYTRVFYKIIQLVRALWLAIKPFYTSVCKHGFRSSFASRRGFLRLSRVLPTSRVFTSGYVNTETILHFFNEKNGSAPSCDWCGRHGG